jgi:hypothetical protein
LTQVSKSKKEPIALFESELLQRMFINHVKNYMDVILISSRTKGLHTSDERSFGAGKSTLALWFSYAIHWAVYYSPNPNKKEYNPFDKKIWDLVLKHIVGTRDDFLNLISQVQYHIKIAKSYEEAMQYRIPCLIWDDVQASLPAMAGAPKWLVDLIGLITVERPAFSNLILTAPSIDAIAKPLRRHITYEVIVYERGKAEVQKIEVRKNFRRPDSDLFRMLYLYDIYFDPVPQEVYEKYFEIRSENVKKITKNYYVNQPLKNLS